MRHCLSTSSSADGVSPRRGHRADGPARVDNGIEVAGHRALRVLERSQFDGDFGDDAERSLGSDHEARQIVTGHTLGGLASEAHEVTGAGHDLHAEHVVTGDAVLDAAQSARVGGDVPSDRRPR